MIKNYPRGSNLTILNTFYLRSEKDENGKWGNDKLNIIFRDNATGLKHHEEIENPTYDFFMAKDDVYIDHNQLFIEKDKLEKITVPYNSLKKEIASTTGNLEFFYDNLRNGNGYANNKLFSHPRIFMADQDIEDRTRFNFSNYYQNNTYSITKSFLDIEADIIDMKGDFPEMGECPINAITIIDGVNDKVYTLLLRNSDNPLIEQFERSIDNKLFERLKEFIRDAVGGWKNEKRLGLDKLEYEMMFYDEEIQLIQDLFILLNTTNPDFVLAWNMAFDMTYIIERIKMLGYSPEDIICHPNFETKIAKYYIDTRNENDLAARGDNATISSYSVYLDQMIQFASRRKGQSLFPDYKLDTIGKIIAGVRKLDYSHITTNIAKFPYLDYETFVFYNIMDTIVQKCIEQKVKDIDYVFNKCLLNDTRYSKCHRQTVYLVNRGIKDFYADDFIMGCNNNRFNQKDEKFPGAFVADASKIDDYAKTKINGRAIDIFDNVDDYDAKSLYPSVMREFGIAPNTQIGSIEIPEQVHANENRFDRERFKRGSAFLEDLQSHGYLEFCTRWFKLADYGTLYKDIIDYFTNVENSAKALKSYNGRDLVVMRFLNKEFKQKIISFNTDKQRVIDINYRSDFRDINDHFDRRLYI